MLENIDFLAVILLVAGTAATVFGLVKLIQHGVTLLIWLVLLIAGIWGITYGWTHLDEQIQPALPDEIREQLEALDVTEQLYEWCNQL